MRYDFSAVEDVDSFATIPEGVYDCRVGAVRVGHTRDGHERWALRLDVCSGDYAGRVAAWDGLTWSDKGAQRVKFVLQALGLDSSGEVEVQPEELEGRMARVVLVLEEWEDPLTRRRQVRLRVPFRGYEPLPTRNGVHPAGEEPEED
jgi:hypothetical protein